MTKSIQLQTQHLLELPCHQLPDLDLSRKLLVGTKPQHQNPHILLGMEGLAQIQCRCGTEIEVWLAVSICNRAIADSDLAAPQPTPKHFTDEELKQQYGIHLATRLQADADGKESKWADIDDDEDDWAPETIEWNDGTKIDLSQNNQAAILAEEQARAMVEKERLEEERRSKLDAQQKTTTTVGPNATVLKPRSAVQPKTGGVVLKASTDKPTLVAKSAAPTPVRSPWASLPPVEKVPPVDINPPSQSLTFRTQQNDTSNTNIANPVPQPPAMEIAADDFTRTRRDNQTGNLGQLYNAQSGQYEPAIAGRRGSVRKEQNFRPPSLLQRGSQYEQQAPAEPSAAFQTQRASGQPDHAPWTRRGSSTVSGDSGPLGRRTSTSKGSEFSRVPNDLLQNRRESQPLVSPTTPSFKNDHQVSSALQSPAPHYAQAIQEARSTTGSPYQSRNAAADVAQASQRDEVAAQKALMKEKRELAIKRKKEEEEREEAAKKERIRIKMEKLGMAPLEEKKEKKEPEKKELEKKEPEKKQIEKKLTEDIQPETKELEMPGSSQLASQAPAQPQDLLNHASQSPPKPPAPDASGASRQYGMMRVHGAPLSSAPQSVSERLVGENSRNQPLSQSISPPGLESKKEAVENLPPPMVNGIKGNQKEPEAAIYGVSDIHNQNLGREPRQQLWNAPQRDQPAYGAWNGQAVAREPSVSTSVWGPTSQSRALGNGTFDRSIQRPQSRPLDQFSSPALAPIGPPRHLQRSREGPEMRAENISPVPLVEDFQTIPTFPPSEAPTSLSGKPNLIGQSASTDTHKLTPGNSIGPHGKTQINGHEQPLREGDQHSSIISAWGSFKASETEKNRQLAQQNAARLSEDARNGIQRPMAQLPIMNETWRQVRIDDQSIQRQVVGVSRAKNAHDRVIAPPTTGEYVGPPFMSQASLPHATAANIGRGSRFFPGAGASLQSQYQGALRFPPGYRRSSSPPPPEDEVHLHPAYARDPTRPLVRLPYLKASSTAEDTTPKVRLPPSIIAPVPSPPMPEARSMPFRAVSQPLVNNPSWQDRFNGLLGVKKTTPEKKFAVVADGFSATKVPFDLPSVRSSASVSLPPQTGEPASRVLEPDSKHVEDEEGLFENREFGSLPAVTIPTKAPEVGWMDAKNLKRGQSKHSKLSREVDAASRDVLPEKEMIVNGNALIFVKMLGMELSKSVPMPRPNVPDTAQGTARQRNFASNSKPNKGYKSRESSGHYGNNPKNNQATASNNTTQSSMPPQSRGQQGKNRPAWGPRTATAVH